MNNYAENRKRLEAIRNKYGEPMFRMAVSHLMDVGIRHLTKELVEETCEEIMKEDDSKSFMTNGFKCDLIKAAYELAQISQIDLLVYIQREVTYDVNDNMPSYERAINLLKRCMDQIESDEMYDNREVYNVFDSIGFIDDELEEFGFKYLIEEE